MEGHARTWFTPKQKAELWERWRSGQCVADIARALERRNKSGVYRVLALNGGIAPAPRRRAAVALRLARVDCFPAHAAFPKWQEGRHPHCHFRGLLRLQSRYGPPDCSAAQGDLCHEAPAQPVARPSRSSATRSIDNSLGGIFLH